MPPITPPTRPVLSLVLSVVSLASIATGALGATPSRFHQPSFDAIRPLVQQGIDRGELPGCVVAIGDHAGIAFLRAYGNRSLEPSKKAMTTDTVFDLASLTKPIATATSVMRLLETGQLRLKDKAADLLPGFGANGKKDISIEQLLTHTSGLIPDNPLSDYRHGSEEAWKRIYDLAPIVPPGTEFKYSDVNFLVLGRIVQELSGKPLNEFAADEIFRPLGMPETGYLPGKELQDRAAPHTRRDDGSWIVGEVHDPRAALLGGVAGHAGLFSTAEDLARYARMMLQQGALDGSSVLSPATVEVMTRGREVVGNIRGLGWDSNSVYSRNRGELMSDRAFGHGGFTGTGIWIDPGRDLFVIFLSNRLHPDDNGSVNDLIGRIGTIACAAIEQPHASLTPATNQDRVSLGIDKLREEGFAPLVGKRVGLITNHTGVDSQGSRTIDLLAKAEGVELVRLFSPEHGVKGVLDEPGIKDAQDEATGLKVASLYGDRRKPAPEQLADLDVLVFDIQDIGCRFYTYTATMRLAMEAAHEAGIEYMVLDRPNPIDGVSIEGPMLDPGQESFVGTFPMPVRYGMTIGELAQMFLAAHEAEGKLTVVPVRNWDPHSTQAENGQLWINPSPNMRSLRAAILYPGIGLLETTNLSVGRGTDTPFELVGAPWIDPWEFANAINAVGCPGVRVIPRRFTPNASKHEGVECGGIGLMITDPAAFDSVELGLAVASVLRGLYPDDWETKRYNRLLINQEVFDAVVNGAGPQELARLSEKGVDDFLRVREAALLYER
ncbi:Penicillin-binding protein 4* [Posidoniimonas polymericola]|uniref:Penicillin-binding protein 4 n=1 Tax=Posidoniimonas polymericola TaxID=2528002 RepID=A0A5C5YAI8_9BACT|nr:exo-beta-N-acetylmuramidase NamZ domain-containing protein [Posidoniimonas polymericola]TWT72697.1 Penicillin-binding protein 4* [Posidoniimonas polymericola]